MRSSSRLTGRIEVSDVAKRWRRATHAPMLPACAHHSGFVAARLRAACDRGLPIVEQAETRRSGSRHTGKPAARLCRNRAQHLGDRGRDRDRCAFEIIALCRKPGEQSLPPVRRHFAGGLRHRSADSPGARPSALNTSLVGTATPGWTMTIPSFGSTTGADRISPIPLIRRGRGSTQTGTSAPVARAASPMRGSPGGSPFALARSRNAAAASADPPPSPAPAGSRLVNAKRPSRTPSMRSASARAARTTRLSSTAPACPAVGPATASSSSVPGRNVRRSPNGANATKLSRS